MNIPKFLVVTIFFLIFPAVSFAQVSKIVFTTDAQSVKPNVLSGPITIQSKDSGGNAYQTPETIDLEFISTSATGEFLGGTGNPATTYMSKNTANRTFYYKDSSEGNFTITINAKGRETGEEWNVSQRITISSNVSQGSSDNNSSGEILGASAGSSSSSASSQSAGGSATNASSPNAQLEVVTGNDKITSPGSPTLFQATVKKNNTSNSTLEFSWSFGDGNVGVGPLVSHIYKYSGDYAVVLNARAGDVFSVSRFKVKVIDSDISVSDKDEYLEISNNSNTEVNLFNWKIENSGKGFVFQPNTIILPRSSIKLDKNLLTMKGLDNSLGTCLKNFLGEEVFAIAPIKELNLSGLSKNLEVIKKEFSVIQEKAKNLNLALQNNISSVQPVSSTNSQQANVFLAVSENEKKADLTSLPQATTSVENIIYEAPKSESLISKLTNFIKRVFSN